MVSENLKDCFSVLKFAAKIKDPKKRALIISVFDKCLLSATQELSYNLLYGDHHVTPKQIKRLKKYKWGLRGLAAPVRQVSLKKKKQLLSQRGGGILSILIPTLASIVTSLIGNGAHG